MSGWKDWQIGEVVTEGDFQSLVQDQVVQRYADATARNTALGTAVAEGMVAYLDDTNAVQVYNGTAWIPIGEGDITGVTAGTALTGGGTSGDVTLNVNLAAITIPPSQVTGLTATAAALNTIDDGTSGFTALSNGTAGISYQPVSDNYIMNGGMDIAQRGTSFTNVSFTYHLDRWEAGRGGFETGLNISRVTSGLTDIRFAMRVQRASGNTSTQNFRNAYMLETADSIPLAGKAVTLSFFARRGADWSAPNLDVALVSGTGTDQGDVAVQDNFTTGAATVVNQTLTLTTTYQRFTITGTVASSATQLAIRIRNNNTGTAGANDWYEITGVQLEAGSVATPFKRHAPSLQGELAACQRYFYRATVGAEGAGNIENVCHGQAYATTNAVYIVRMPQEMRATPSLSVSSAGHFITTTAAFGNATATALSLSGQSTRRTVRLDSTVASGLVAGNITTLLTNNASGTLDLSSEL